MNGNLFKIVLISVIAILLAIIGGAMSADGDPVSIALAISPFVLAGLCLMKEKVWYLWIFLPPFFIISAKLSSYGPLVAYTITLPFYLWNVMLRRSSLTWNSIPLLDITIFLLFVHVIYVFLTHPFGLGLNIMEDYYGGKGYITFLQGLIAYLCLSSLNTTSNELGKVLQWSIVLIVLSTLALTVLNILSPDSVGANMGEATGAVTEKTRNRTFNSISTLTLQLLILNYSPWQIIKRPWYLILVMLSVAGIFIGGGRLNFAILLTLFLFISVLYKRWVSSIVMPSLVVALLSVLSFSGFLRELPFSAQRILSAVPFLYVSYQAKADAEGSLEWRKEMWRWALDDRERFIQDKTFGDGFSRDTNILKANIYEEAYRLSNDQSAFAWNGDWHSGVISTIQTIGYVGLTLYIIMSIIGMSYAYLICCIYKYHKYRLGILFIAALYFIRPLTFLLLFGVSTDIYVDIIALGIIKILYSCAKKEGLYIPFQVHKEYVPLIIMKRNMVSYQVKNS